MLMFVFGAGASFDSDPERRDPSAASSGHNFRPPLAPGLFSPDNDLGKSAVADFPAAQPLLMRLRQATRRNEDVEEVLERLASSSDVYDTTAKQLLAFRAYLARLLSQIPSKWSDECQGLTNYVTIMEQADRWNRVVHPHGEDPIACVTFNYDVLLEQAVNSVYSHRLRHMDSYIAHPDIHVFKPHGSVSWRQSAGWDQPSRLMGGGGLDKAIGQASSLAWSEDYRFQVDDEYQDRDDATKVWLPALSIPVRRKTTFTMPQAHRDMLELDLRKVTTLVAVGWRAREQHFLKLMQDHLGSSLVGLVAVAESDESAQQTIDNLWVTGRFDRFAISGNGFSGFAEIPEGAYQRRPDPEGHTQLSLQHVLRAGPSTGVWTNREPHAGSIPDDVVNDLGIDVGYVDL